MILSPLPIQKFFGNDGKPLNGGQLFTYVVGTSTKIATYTDASGGTPNTNPIILDYRGEARIWIDPTLTYKFVLAPANDTDPPTAPIWSVDNIAGGVTIANLTPQFIGQILWPRNAQEIAAGVTPSNYGYPWNDQRRYASVADYEAVLAQGTSYSAYDNATQLRQLRGTFTLPVTGYFFGDSFWEQPNAHTSSGNSMAFKAAALIGVTANINATSGNTSVDKQAAIFSLSPAVTDLVCNDLGQNDAQFVGTGADIERRQNDIATIQLANYFHMGAPSSRTVLATAMAQAGTWAADGDIAEGGALVSATNASALQATLTDTRYAIIIYKIKTASGGTFNVNIDGNAYTSSFDEVNGFISAPMGNIPTNTGLTYARCALVFDLGRRKPITAVQMVVSSATNAANPVSICSCIGLSGDPLAGPLVVGLDLSDRGPTGYATAAGSQASVPIVSRIINQVLAVAGACGIRVVPVQLSAIINVNTMLDTDQFHPNEAGAIAGAQGMATAIQRAATDWSVNRPDLDALSLINGATGYVLLSPLVTAYGPNSLPSRQLMSPRAINWDAPDVVPCATSIRIVNKAGGIPDANGNALYLARDTGAAGLAYTGNLGATGDYMLVARGASRVRLSDVNLFPVTTGTVDLGAAANTWGYGFFSKGVTTPPLTVATLPGTATAGTRAFVNNATQTLTAGIGAVVAGGGANSVPVVYDGAAWRIG